MAVKPFEKEKKNLLASSKVHITEFLWSLWPIMDYGLYTPFWSLWSRWSACLFVFVFCPFWSFLALIVFGSLLRFLWSIMVYYGPSWSIMVHHGILWSIMVHHVPSWSITVRHGPSWSIMFHHGPSWSFLVSCGPLCVVLYGLLWPFIVLFAHRARATADFPFFAWSRQLFFDLNLAFVVDVVQEKRSWCQEEPRAFRI